MTDDEVRKEHIAAARRQYEATCKRAFDKYERDVEFWTFAKINRNESGEYKSAGWYTMGSRRLTQ